ncbi:MAG: beta-lactamase family protein, partial [bacterium]|nr:beta-lactamase family protein [Candidatus Kapabacteria bacterium]
MSIRYLCLAALIVLCATTSSPAQQSSTFPTELAARLSETLDDFRRVNNAIGVTAAIVSPRYGTWADASGDANSNTGDSMRHDMLLGIGSITKTLTSAAILDLVDERRIELDDTIGTWITGYGNINGRVTVRQLLNHTSGLFDYTSNNAFWVFAQSDLNQNLTPDDILPFVGPPVFSPGLSWQYCNTGYILLGMIIERVTGKTFEQDIASRFLAPLGIDAIAMGTLDTLPGVVADNWIDVDGDGDLDNLNELPRKWLYSGAWAAGGLFGDAASVARWGNQLYTGRLLSPAMMSALTTFRSIP